jgi:hypothetical protein
MAATTDRRCLRKFASKRVDVENGNGSAARKLRTNAAGSSDHPNQKCSAKKFVIRCKSSVKAESRGKQNQNELILETFSKYRYGS